MNDKSWDNLYWTPESMRPDRLAKILNSIIRKEDGDSERFIYDRQAAMNEPKVNLTGYKMCEINLSQGNIEETESNLHGVDGFNSLKKYDYHDPMK
jgi:hypothetical protein